MIKKYCSHVPVIPKAESKLDFGYFLFKLQMYGTSCCFFFLYKIPDFNAIEIVNWKLSTHSIAIDSTS